MSSHCLPWRGLVPLSCYVANIQIYVINVKNIMAISYSLSKKRMTFGKESGKLYATAQHIGVVGEMEFAKRVSRRVAKPPVMVGYLW